MATVTLTGRAGADPELRYTPNGSPVATVNVAETHRRRNPAGEWTDDGTSWYRVTVWGKPGEAMVEQVRKGALVVVTGDLRVKEYITDSGKGRAAEITATSVGVVPAPVQGASKLGTNSEDPWANDAQGAGW